MSGNILNKIYRIFLSIFNLNCITATEFPLTDENFNENEFIIKSKQLLKLLNKKGILNVGGKIQSIYNFAKIENPKIKKIFLKKNKKINMPINPSINTKKMKKILKNK